MSSTHSRDINESVDLLEKSEENSDFSVAWVDSFSKEPGIGRGYISCGKWLETDKLPDIDILVNNVGIFRGKNFYDETEKDWKDHIQVNLLGGVKLSKHFLPKMIKKNWGRIIFVSSECATLVPGDLLSYSVSKASVNVFSSGLAKLTKGTNVTVNTIIPGSTLSEGSKIFLKEAAKRENKTIEEVESNFFKM